MDSQEFAVKEFSIGGLWNFAAFFIPGTILLLALICLIGDFSSLKGIFIDNNNNGSFNQTSLVIIGSLFAYCLGSINSTIGGYFYRLSEKKYDPHNNLDLLNEKSKDEDDIEPNIYSLIRENIIHKFKIVFGAEISEEHWRRHSYYLVRTYVKDRSPNLSRFAERQDCHRLLLLNSILPIVITYIAIINIFVPKDSLYLNDTIFIIFLLLIVIITGLVLCKNKPIIATVSFTIIVSLLNVYLWYSEVTCIKIVLISIAFIIVSIAMVYGVVITRRHEILETYNAFMVISAENRCPEIGQKQCSEKKDINVSSNKIDIRITGRYDRNNNVWQWSRVKQNDPKF